MPIQYNTEHHKNKLVSRIFGDHLETQVSQHKLCSMSEEIKYLLTEEDATDDAEDETEDEEEEEKEEEEA